MSFIHEKALVSKDAIIGENCVIEGNSVIGAGASIGDGCVISSGAYICPLACIGKNVKVGPNVVFAETGDFGANGKSRVMDGVIIGGGTVILPVSVGCHSVVEAGSVVTKDVPPYAIVSGNPAVITGYVGTGEKYCDSSRNFIKSTEGCVHTRSGASLYALKTFSDIRGDLLPIEFKKCIPFRVKRVFFVYNVYTGSIRGEHAHKECHQFLVAVNGSLNVVCDNGKERDEFILDSPSVGLYIIPGVWGVQYSFSRDAVLAVFASHDYDDSDYIRNYFNFLEFKNANERG